MSLTSTEIDPITLEVMRNAFYSIADEMIVRDLIPELKRNGAEGIIEYPLNKVVY